MRIPSGPGSMISRTEAGYMEAVAFTSCGCSSACKIGADHTCRHATTVYPRVCGGTRRIAGKRPSEGGLSPRVRGNRLPLAGPPDRGGSIPACAGEPQGRAGESSGAAVYPRVCGGTGALGPPLRHRNGLSPRVRGNPQRCPFSAIVPGSIPACAGEPC